MTSSDLSCVGRYALPLVALLLLLPVTAVAQSSLEGGVSQSESAQAAPKRQSRLLEEVVVTAQKREENVQDVPIAIQAFSGEQLDALGVSDPKDLQAITPGLTYNSVTAFSIIYLRGVGSDAFLMADPSVATYIDGIYYPFSSGSAQGFGKVERIEVLKGPQGTLFGRNTTGGAISVTTETPSFDEFYGSIGLGYGSFNTYEGKINLNIPITDYLAASVAAFHNISDNYYEYTEDSGTQNLPEEVSKGYRAKLKLGLEWFEVTLAATRIDEYGVNTALSPNTETSDLQDTISGSNNASQPKDYTASVDAPISFDIDSQAYYGEIKFYTSMFDIKFLASEQSVENLGLTDFDGTNEPTVFFGAPLFSDVETQELQFLSNGDSWGSDWLTWIAGLYHIKSIAGLDPTFALFGGESGGLLPTVADVTQVLTNPTPAGLLSLSGGVVLDLQGLLRTESQSAFFQTSVQLTDSIQMIIGARYQEEDRKVLKSTADFVDPATGSKTRINDAVNDGQGFSEASTTNFSPKFALNYAPTDELLIYATWQKAFKGGTFNTINITDDMEYAKPENVISHELGFKYTSDDQHFLFNFAVFHTSIRNLQVQFSSLLAGGAVTFENAEGARSQGAEFDTRIFIMPSRFDEFILTLSGAYLDTRYTDFSNGTGFDEETGAYQENQDFTGNATVRTPRWTGRIALNKSFYFKAGPLELGADAYYNSGYSYLAQATLFREEEYGLINARASFLFEEYDVRVSVNANNLDNTTYAYSQFPNDFGRLEALAPPTNYQLKVNWNF